MRLLEIGAERRGRRYPRKRLASTSASKITIEVSRWSGSGRWQDSGPRNELFPSLGRRLGILLEL